LSYSESDDDLDDENSRKRFKSLSNPAEEVTLDEESAQRLVNRVSEKIEPQFQAVTTAAEQLQHELNQQRIQRLERELAEAKKAQAQLIEDSANEVVSHPQGWAQALRIYYKNLKDEREE